MYYFNHQQNSGLSNRNQKYELINNKCTPYAHRKQQTASETTNKQQLIIKFLMYVNEKQFLFTNKCNDPTFADVHSISNKPPLGFKIN